jgi:hypothetical protein
MFAVATKCVQEPIAPTIEYIGTTTTTTSSTSLTFSNVSIGSVGQDRKLIITVAARTQVDNGTPSLTVDGISATRVTTLNAIECFAEIFVIDFPTGTTATMVVSHPEGSMSATWLSVYAVRNLYNLNAQALVQDETNNASSFNFNLTAQTPGFAIAVTYNSNNRTSTYSGITERYDISLTPQTFTRFSSGASDNFSSSGAKSISCTLSGTGGVTAASCAFFGTH